MVRCLVLVARGEMGMGKRRDPRIQATLQVRIAGIDASGRPLLQMVTTRNISRPGALLDGIQGAFKPGEIISVSYKNNNARFRVSWIGDTGTDRAGQMGLVWAVGLYSRHDIASLFKTGQSSGLGLGWARLAAACPGENRHANSCNFPIRMQ